MPLLSIFVAYALTSTYDEDKTRAFDMDLEKSHRKSTHSYLRDSAKSAECLRSIKRRLSYETLALIGQRGAAGNYQLKSELEKRCRETINEDLKEREAAVLA
ncbi:hypothetical protein ANCDUO_02988 [Ancylostoma duodenale]|uniref:Uncharacterized protein n=1 Tax=Ancylostoma duodenale TaxID=51022 RepID=A0A0C2H551_9BILA|nr:hypothetical protein ANCDUO_02988 [Ancylostoma duodenale]